MLIGRFLRLVLVLAFIALLGFLLAPSTSMDLSRSVVPVQLATTSSPLDIPIEDILSGKYQPGFYPMDADVLRLALSQDEAVWVRIKADIPSAQAGVEHYLRIERVPLEKITLYREEPVPAAIGESQSFQLGSWDARWPDGFVLLIPVDIQGPTNLYLRLQGNVGIQFLPQITDGTSLTARKKAAWRLFALIYGLLGIGLIFCFVAAFKVEDRLRWQMALTIVLALITTAALNDHLFPQLAAWAGKPIGSQTIYALALMLAAALLSAVQRNVGLSRTTPFLAQWYRRASWVLVALSFAAFYSPNAYAEWVRRVAEVAWVQIILLSLLAFSLDQRKVRRTPLLLTWLLLVSLVIRALTAYDLFPPVPLALYGYQLIIALLLFVFVGMPWVRKRYQNLGKTFTTTLPEKSRKDPVLNWRDTHTQLRDAIDTAFKHGSSQDDIDWIAFRYVLEAIKDNVSQDGAAVILSGIYGQDRIIAEPKENDRRYRDLLDDRERLMKSLARLHTPQQLSIEFFPGDSKTARRVALFPLDLHSAGWGIVLVERAAEVFFTNEELERISHMINQATSAIAGAESARRAQHHKELDQELGILHNEVLTREIRSGFDRCRMNSRPLSAIRIASRDGSTNALQELVSIVREEMTFGTVLGRIATDEVIIVLSGQTTAQARAFAQQILNRLETNAHASISKHDLASSWVVGISSIAVNEAGFRAMLDRAGTALVHAKMPSVPSVQVILPN